MCIRSVFEALWVGQNPLNKIIVPISIPTHELDYSRCEFGPLALTGAPEVIWSYRTYWRYSTICICIVDGCINAKREASVGGTADI